VSSQTRTNVIKYAIAFAVGIALAVFYVSVRDFGVQTLADKYRILCDAFTVPAVLLIMSGALMSISNTGALDGLSYIAKQGLGMFIPGKGLGTERYADYVERKRGNRVKGYSFLYISGCVFMALALVFLIFFYIVFE